MIFSFVTIIIFRSSIFFAYIIVFIIDIFIAFIIFIAGFLFFSQLRFRSSHISMMPLDIMFAIHIFIAY